MDVTNGDCLEGLLDPMSPAEFFAGYLGRQTLVLDSPSESRFRHLLSVPQYQAIVAGLRHTDRTFQHRPSLAHRLNLAGADGYLKMDGVLSGYAQGSSVYLDEIDRRHLPLQALCKLLTDSFSLHERPLAQAGPCSASLAPPRCKALEPHTEPMDLFVLQLDGESHWRFYGSSRCSGEPGSQLKELPPCTREVRLRAGSLVYIPRGFAHSACTTDRYALTVFVRFAPLSWRQLISELMTQHLTLTLEMNRSLSPPTIADGRLSEQGLTELCRTLHGVCESEDFVRRARELDLSRQKTKLESFEDVHRLQSITPDTVIVPVGELKYMVSEERAYLMRADRYLQGPSRFLGKVFESLAARQGPLQVRDVVINGDQATNVELARKLVFEGLHRIEAQPDPYRAGSARTTGDLWTP